LLSEKPLTKAGRTDAAAKMSPAGEARTTGGGNKKLIYELRMLTLGGWGGDDVAALVAVCAAADGKILNTFHVQF
jgi:hypothetical protein